MKAAVYYGVGDVRLEERPVPQAGPGQMVVRIDYCGVCGSDVETYHHPSGKPAGMVLGHENVGTVTQVGEGVTGFAVGDRILCGPPAYCQEGCPSCRRGRPNICDHGLGRTAGIGGPDGGYAEYMLIRRPTNTILVKIPDEVDAKDAVLFDVVCVALHALRRSNFKFGDTVVVSGAGPVGLSAIQLAKAAGARRVVAVDLSPSKRDVLTAYGADACVFLEGCEDVEAAVLSALGTGEGADVTLECAGSKDSLFHSLFHYTRSGGQVVLVGCVGEPADNLVPAAILPREVDIISSFVYTPEEIRMYLDLLAGRKIHFPNMVTDVISLDQLVEQGLDRKNRRGMLKILCAPSTPQNKED